MPCPCHARTHQQAHGDCECARRASRGALLWPFFLTYAWVRRRPEEAGLFVFFALWTAATWWLAQP